MIDIENASYTKYSTENPLYKRIDGMRKHHSQGEKNIVYIVSNRYNASIRYRAENMVKTINRMLDCNAYIFELPNINVVLSNLNLVDIIIFQRVICYGADRYLSCIRENNIPILYDIDDLVFDKKYYGNVHESIFNQVDMIITTNAYLQERLCGTFHKKVYQVNNFMDSVQYELAVALRKKRNQDISNNNFLIGYFGGESHYRDLKMIAPELANFLIRHRDAKLRVIGINNMPEPLACEELKGQIMISQYMDGYKLMEEYSKLDINLIPLVMDDFSQARSEIKFFEAAAVGVVSIASPTELYKKIFDKSQAVILSDIGSWLDELEKVYNNKYNLKDMINKAVKYIEKNYTEEAMIPNLSRIVYDVEKTYAEMLHLGNR